MFGRKKRECGSAADGPAVYVTFYTTAEAFACAAACEKAGIEGRLVTVPRCLSAGCGMAWRSPAGARAAREALVRAGLACEAIEELSA